MSHTHQTQLRKRSHHEFDFLSGRYEPVTHHRLIMETITETNIDRLHFPQLPKTAHMASDLQSPGMGLTSTLVSLNFRTTFMVKNDTFPHPLKMFTHQSGDRVCVHVAAERE